LERGKQKLIFEKSIWGVGMWLLVMPSYCSCYPCVFAASRI